MRRYYAVIIGGILIWSVVPLVASADASLGPSTGAATELGPAASGAATNSNGSSSADSSALQPAGNNPLQSSTSAASGLTAPTSSALQGLAPSSAALQVVQGDADGSPHQLSGGSSWAWLWWLLGVIVVVAAVTLWLRRRPSRTGKSGAKSEPDPEPIRSVTMSVTINRPAIDIFEYTLDPNNTPKWIKTINEEQASDHPPKLGTMYKNRGDSKDWTEFEVTELEPGASFTLSRKDGAYHVRYLFKPAGDDATEFTYREWVDDGELTDPFPPEPLQKLKSLLEKPPVEEPKADSNESKPEHEHEEPKP